MARHGRWRAAVIARAGARLRAAADALAARRAGLVAAPVSFTHAPEPLVIGAVETAQRLASGDVALAGETVRIGALSPWAIGGVSPAWREALHGFGWLDDAVMGGRADRARLRAWAFDWLWRYGRGGGEGWRPDLAGRRLGRLACAAGMLREGAGPADARRLDRALGVHLRFVASRWRAAPTHAGRIEALTGLVLGRLAAGGAEPGLTRAAQLLAGAARDAVRDADTSGTRNPDDLAGIFANLAWSAHALGEVGRTPEPDHAAALATAGPILRALRLGDGGFARFHGGGSGGEALDQAFALASARGRGPKPPQPMGYRRLAAGPIVAILDAAPPPATGAADASPLALEISIGRQRVITNVGDGARFGPDWSLAARATAAHSALELGGVSAARLGPDGLAARTFGRRFVAGPSRVDSETAQDLEGAWLLGEHDGYDARFGAVVARRLHLLHGGAELRGEDTVTAPTAGARRRYDRAARARAGDLPFLVRFHLHPAIGGEPIGAGDGAVLILPSDERWTLRASGGRVSIVEGVYLDPALDRPAPSHQVVIAGRATGYWGRVTWALHRVHTTPRAEARTVAQEAPAGP
jgi:uncharacterized heparinase superfamily protein